MCLIICGTVSTWPYILIDNQFLAPAKNRAGCRCPNFIIDYYGAHNNDQIEIWFFNDAILFQFPEMRVNHMKLATLLKICEALIWILGIMAMFGKCTANEKKYI